MSDGWIEWAGGECPVPPMTKVEHTTGAPIGNIPPAPFPKHPVPMRADDVQQGGDVAATLAERAGQYGSFAKVAETSVRLREVLADEFHRRGKRIAADQEEALQMICTKIARIVNGNADHIDSWHGIAGYAQLVADRLRKESQ